MSDHITILWDGTPRTTRSLQVENGLFVGDDTPRLPPTPAPPLREEPKRSYSWRDRPRGIRNLGQAKRAGVYYYDARGER